MMNKNRWFYLVLIVLLIPAESYGQRWKLQRYEASIGIGSTSTFMDIGSQNFGFTSFRVPGTRPNISVDASFIIMQDFSVQIDLGYIPLSGKDPIDRERGYSFTSHSFEPTARLEYVIVGGGGTFSNALFNRRGMVNSYNRFSLFVFGGAGGILTKSKITDINGEEPLTNPYYDNNSHFSFVIPAGVGVKLNMSTDLSLSLEAGYRYTFSDILDGYQHAVSQFNDQYMLTNVKAIYKIRNDRRGLPKFGGYRRR